MSDILLLFSAAVAIALLISPSITIGIAAFCIHSHLAVTLKPHARFEIIKLLLLIFCAAGAQITFIGIYLTFIN